MLFNSIEFTLFLPLVFTIYWLLARVNLRIQNLFLVAASYVFYGWWDWRFLSLVVFSSIVDFLVGLGLEKSETRKPRLILLWCSILVNLGFLGVFKYFNFFVSSFVDAFTLMGQPIDAPSLNIVLPVGISFYTFQTLSYSIDVFQRKLEPTRDPVAFFAFVSFFPQLVAGPIERATKLLPQFYTSRVFDPNQAKDGLRQILWGLFKKIVIADNCAVIVNEVFANPAEHSGSTLLFAAFMFSFQIYGDFSGYSDIAIGTARLFGFNLCKNFAFPYFSRDIAEFWRRWHISLSSWFRDYVYIPIGGSRGNQWTKIRNIFVIFLLSGLWHGANWTFVVWGGINAMLFLPLMLMKSNRSNLGDVADGRILPSFPEAVRILTTFLLTTLAWVFFRAESLSVAGSFLAGIVNSSLFSKPEFVSLGLIAMIAVLVTGEWIQRKKEHGLELTDVQVPTHFRWAIYYSLVFCIFWFGGQQQSFIYFQF